VPGVGVRSARGTIHLVTFRRGSSQFGVRVGSVRKVLRPSRIEPLSADSGFLFGRIRVEGSVEVVLDPSRFFGEAASETKNVQVILVGSRERGFGFVADHVDAVVEVPRESVRESPPFLAGLHGGVFEGTVPRDDGEILILDLDRLLAMSRAPQRHAD
jgi:chemotaxis signal transduction protein